MNAQNAKDFLPLVQALADGKVIRFQGEEQCEVSFCYPPSEYDIKPEPREWAMWVSPKGELTQNSDMLTREHIRVREILD